MSAYAGDAMASGVEHEASPKPGGTAGTVDHEAVPSCATGAGVWVSDGGMADTGSTETAATWERLDGASSASYQDSCWYCSC